MDKITKWIPVEERVPETDEDRYSDYVLISFANYSIPVVGHYEEDADGNGTFHDGDEDKPLSSYGLIVNAWMPLPKCMGVEL